MQVQPARLAAQLKNSLAPCYLVHGDEDLLVEEACDAIREAARSQGYDERLVMQAEPGFDWNRLTEATQTLSLFSSRRLIELRIPTGRPGEAGAKALVNFAQTPPPDTLLLIKCGKLESATRSSKWAKALDAAGVVVTCWPVAARELPGWIRARLQQRELRVAPGVVELLAHHLEGNLLALAQEIDKLALDHGTSEIGLEEVEASVADSARFDVYGFVDTCLGGDARKVLRMLGTLQAGGVEPALLIWALGREIRAMQRLAADVAAGGSQAEVFKSHRVWAKRKSVVAAALSRIPYERWLGLLRQMARLDRVLKGRSPGDVWAEIERVSLAVCGINPMRRAR